MSQPSDDSAGATPAADPVFLATAPAGAVGRRLALLIVGLSASGFAATIPFARVPLAGVPGFIAAYEAALAVGDLISAVLLFTQFAQLRRRALLALASGYLFNAFMIVPHALTFPGAFAATGLLGAGTQTTGWLYVFWHGGFALAALGYGILGPIDDRSAVSARNTARAIALAVLGALACALVLTVIATAGQDHLPVIIQGSDFSLLITKGVSPTLIVLCLAALIVVVWRPKQSVLDLWVMVVLCAWLFDVMLSAVIASARFDLGWYAGRSYGLLAASFVLIVLLAEVTSLQRRLAAANDALADHARGLGDRVREQTQELAASNSALRQEIADRRKTEAQLVQAQKMEAIGSLSGGMAHDFNNLLGVIIGNLDLVREAAPAPSASADLLDEALDAALKGAELTKRLLAFARRQPLQPRLIDVNEHIATISKLLERTLGRHIEISLALAPELWTANVDPPQLEAAITNLATNARDAMPKGGRLLIATRNVHLDADYVSEHVDTAPGDYVLIEVSDTGEGIPPEIIAHVFEPFFTTKEQGKGTGLGLSMVFGFLRQSGGHINVYSERGEGTTFRLYLPRAAQHGAETGKEQAAAPPAGGGETVLVVEDNDKIVKVVVRQLTGLGYRVLTADTARAAVAIIDRGEPIDLLLTDVVMPGGMSGIDLAREVNARHSGLKILLTSGFAEGRFGDGRLGGLPWRMLSKPYRREDLARAVRETLDNAAPTARDLQSLA